MAKLIQFCTQASLYDGPFDSKAGWHAAGMGYILVAENGKLCVIDGGNAEDAEAFFALLKQYGGEKPQIPLWILTHSHSDHVGVLDKISRTPEMREQLEVGEVIYYFPEDFVEQNGSQPGPQANKKMKGILAALGAKAHAPELGEERAAEGFGFRFLYHPYDTRILHGAGNCNLCSLIFTVQTENKRIMFTGDAYTRNLQVVEWIYRRQLTCDILQMPHHGLCDTGHLPFYKGVNAKTLLIPTCVAGDRAMHGDLYANSEKRRFNLWAEENAEHIYRSYEGTAEIEI